MLTRRGLADGRAHPRRRRASSTIGAAARMGGGPVEAVPMDGRDERAAGQAVVGEGRDRRAPARSGRRLRRSPADRGRRRRRASVSGSSTIDAPVVGPPVRSRRRRRASARTSAAALGLRGVIGRSATGPEDGHRPVVATGAASSRRNSIQPAASGLAVGDGRLGRRGQAATRTSADADDQRPRRPGEARRASRPTRRLQADAGASSAAISRDDQVVGACRRHPSAPLQGRDRAAAARRPTASAGCGRACRGRTTT